MSFDETFNYAPVVTGLGEEKAVLEAALAVLNNEKNMLDAATAYAADIEVINRKIQLQIEIDRKNTNLTAIIAVLAEIAEVQGLAANKKEDLNFFYSIVETAKQDFMARILFNHDRALNDTKIAALRADTVTPAPTRVAIAKLYYTNYIIAADVINVVMSIYCYIV